MRTLKVRVDYQETWNRTALVEVDADEVREWLGRGSDYKVTSDDVRRFFEATDYDGMGEAPPWVTGETPDQHKVPGNGVEGVTDEYDGNDLDSVSLIEDVTAFALVNSFARNAPVSYHLGRTEYVNSDTTVDMLCGARAVIPDRPVKVSNQKVCAVCSAFEGLQDRLRAQGKPQEVVDAVLPKVDA